MKRVKELLLSKNTIAGYLYFYIHFVTEVICFYFLGKIVGNNAYIWTIFLMYDALAFVPQSLIGAISDKYPKINMGLIGLILLIMALILTSTNLKYLPLIVLCLGNALIHVNGSEVTIRSSNGYLSGPAIFVAGGSFGVILGKVLASFNINKIFIILLGLTTISFILLAEYYKKESKPSSLEKFNYHNKKLRGGIIIVLTMLIIVIRGFMGYALPTSWNKTLSQNVMLFVMMGFGKALGGILSDLIGIYKTALISIIGSLPFLLFGDNYMFISLIGVLGFSMTMAITLGLLISVLKTSPGLAFGLTTISLFLGTLPIFFFKITSTLINCIVIIILTIICLVIALNIIDKGRVKT